METNKISIRFYHDHEVRAIWQEEQAKWWFSVVDIIGAIHEQSSYEKNRNYWKYLKNKLKKEKSELVSNTNQLKLVSADGKRYLTDTLDLQGVQELAVLLKATQFLDWFTYSDNTIDGQSRKKAYSFWQSNLVADSDIGTTQALQQIHAYIFGGLYDFAGQIRTKTISKGTFTFCLAQYLTAALQTIDGMPENTFEEIVDKYIEMNVAHPFMEGNGRSTRIWLDLILKKRLGQCVDWSKVPKQAYLDAMVRSTAQREPLCTLLRAALIDKIDDRDVFLKGIDYSYYYEQQD